MELLKYEIYKIFSRKVVLIGLIVFIPIYLIYTFGMNVSYLSSYREASGYYKVYEGKPDSNKIEKINEGIKEVEGLYKQGVRLDSKHLSMKILYLDMTNLMQDRKSLDGKRSGLENELKKYSPGDFEYKKASLELKNIDKTQALYGLYYKEGWRAVINFYHDIGYWFIFIFSLLGISGIISLEYADGVNSLIRSTRKGKREIVIAKAGAAFIYVSVVTAFVAVLNLITNAYFYSLSGSNISIRNIYDLFGNSSSNIRIWQYYIVLQVLIIFGVFAVSLVYVLLSIFFVNSRIPFMFELIVFFASDKISRDNGGYLAKGLLPSEFLRLDNLFRDYTYIYNVFGQPVTYEKLVFIVNIIVILFLFTTVIKSFERFGLRDSQ